jgi:hypothetical protein
MLTDEPDDVHLGDKYRVRIHIPHPMGAHYTIWGLRLLRCYKLQ